MLLQVCSNTLQEGFIPQVVAEHSNDGAPLEITDMVENLIDLKSVPNWYFNRM